MMKKIYFIVVILLLIYYLIPTISAPIYYSKNKINRLINLSESGDANATIMLTSYYLANKENDNLSLVVCQMRTDEVKFKNKLDYFDDKNVFRKECPKNPLKLLENSYFLKYINYVFRVKKTPS